MAYNVPTYLIKNSFGIYNFQYRFTPRLRKICPSIPNLFRRSLSTGCRKTALKQAKYWLMVMDELTQKLLTEPDLFGKAMTLLKKYQNLDGMDWQTAEQFLIALSEDETEILERAIEQNQQGVIQLPSFKSSADNQAIQNQSSPTVHTNENQLDELVQVLKSVVQGQKTVNPVGQSITIEELAI